MPETRPSSRRAPAPWIGAGLSLLAVLATATAAGPAGPEIVSVTPAGAPGNGACYEGAVTPNGRFVAFWSEASDLVPGDTNAASDVFVRDRRAGTTARVSVDSDGNPGDDVSYVPAISASGRYVVFQSDATNLVPGDTNGATDAFVHDAKTGETSRVSTAEDGTEGNNDSFLEGSSISGNGRFVTFYSSASNLVPGDTNDDRDIFVRDLRRGTITRVSVDSDGNEGNDRSYNPSISANGRFAAFFSNATNLVPGDTNGREDVFVRDLKRGTIARVSVDSDGNEGNDPSYDPSISANGRFVAFWSRASNLVPGDTDGTADAFVHDLRTGETRRVSVDSAGQQGNDDSYDPALPSNGRFVVFHSDASNLVPGDTNLSRDVFLHDLRTGETRRLSVDAQAAGGNGNSYMYAPSLSPNGRFLAINSAASNFAAGDANGAYDVFLLDLR